MKPPDLDLHLQSSDERIKALFEELNGEFDSGLHGGPGTFFSKLIGSIPWYACLTALSFGLIASIKGTPPLNLYIGTLAVVVQLFLFYQHRNERRIRKIISILRELEMKIGK